MQTIANLKLSSIKSSYLEFLPYNLKNESSLLVFNSKIKNGNLSLSLATLQDMLKMSGIALSLCFAKLTLLGLKYLELLFYYLE